MYCACGCGQLTPLAKHTGDGLIKGQPCRWIRGHRNYIYPPQKFGKKPEIKSTDGYVLIYRPRHQNAGKSGYVLRSRYVMATHLGRPLRADEHVHHVNRDKTDDRVDNLQVVTPSEHAKLHMAIDCDHRRQGSRNGNSKLSEPKVAAIRHLLESRDDLSQENIGHLFGVTQMLISRIHRNVNWTHITSQNT